MSQHTTLTSLFSDIADSIRSKTGSSDPIPADDFPEYIETIETGSEIGHNILRGTGKLTSGSGSWATGTFRASGATFGSTWNVITINDSPVSGIDTAFTLVANSSQTYPGYAQDGYTMTGHIGDQLTFSVWVKGDVGSDIVLQPYWSGTSGEEESANQTFTLTSTEWTQFVYTSPAIQYNHNNISIGYIYTHSTSAIQVTGMMLEWGEKSTAWMPAKEDLINIGDTTAAAGDVVASKVFYTSTGVKTTGTIASKSSSDLTASGATVTAPAGYYASAASKSVSSGSATTPATTVTVAPSISVSAAGVITASNSGTKSVTPTISAGYVSSGTAGTITVNGSNTKNLTTKAATTITPSTSAQTAVTSGTYCTGNITVGAIPNQSTGGAKYATTSAQTLVSAPKYITSNITLGALSQSNLSAANIKNGVTISISNGSSNVWSVKGTAPIRYAYTATLYAGSTRSFPCATNAGGNPSTLYYVSFNPGFTPSTILVTDSGETLRRTCYDSSLSTYVVAMQAGQYWACTCSSTTAYVSSSSCVIPVAVGARNYLVKAFA